ncbi:MAG: phosphopyruvate hydratase [Clostridia bacterium]|nr:phosphopyruvate hydratase [Clostridia bacterium]
MYFCDDGSVISAVYGSEILDSRGNPTVAATVVLRNGVCATGMSPSGASTGSHEAVELRDGDKSRYNGKGVMNAVENINKILSKVLIGKNVFNQYEIDRAMTDADGTENKSEIGANAILAVSSACVKAAAKTKNMPLYRYVGGISSYNLPIPMLNIINGGVHAKNNIEIQEFMIVPVGSLYFSDGLRKSTEVYHALKHILTEKGLSTAVGDEGGFAPDLDSDAAAIELILDAVDSAGYSAPDDFMIALDVASSEWTDSSSQGKYLMPKHNTEHTTESLIMYMKGLITHYPILSIEDPLSEDDFDGWKQITSEIGGSVQLVGDDLFVTDKTRLRHGITERYANSILIKPNQVGTITETIDTVSEAHRNGFNSVMSHRSGETEDTMIADLAVGLSTKFIKSGAPCRAERTAKYNRLLQIEREMRG